MSAAGAGGAAPMGEAGDASGEPRLLQRLLSGPRLVALKFDHMSFTVSKPVDRRAWRARVGRRPDR